MVFSIKIFVFWSLIGCKIAIFGTIFRLRNWFGDSNANCHFTTEICMFVPSNLYMKSEKVSYNCFFLTFSWKRMEKLKNMYFIYKFIIGCPLLSSHPVVVTTYLVVLIYYVFTSHTALSQHSCDALHLHFICFVSIAWFF